jgi:hypothetical protein
VRWVVLVMLAACGRVGFDASGVASDATDGMLDTLITSDGATPSLLLYLPFDDDPTDGADNLGIASGTGICTPTCPTSVSGKRGNAYHFNGTNQGVRFPHDARFALQSGTFAAWVLLEVAPTAAGHDVIGGIAYGPVGANTFEMFVYDANPGVFLSTGGDANMFGTGGPYVAQGWSQTGVWTHVAMTWTAGAMQRLVVNGVTVTTDFTFTTTYDTHDLMIGADEEPGAFEYFWQGSIDEVVLTDRELTDAEIEQLIAL